MNNSMVTNILLVGVGGQGILVASEIIAETLMLAGFDVKKVKSTVWRNVAAA